MLMARVLTESGMTTLVNDSVPTSISVNEFEVKYKQPVNIVGCYCHNVTDYLSYADIRVLSNGL